MKRCIARRVFAPGAVTLALIAILATVQAPRTAVYTASDQLPDAPCVESSGKGNQPARAQDLAVSPRIAWIPSRPVVPGMPAVSRAPDGTTFGPFHAYTPSDICTAYGVKSLHAEGITGKGQTIVIVDLWGSPTALEDLQAFSRAYELPDPDLTIIYPDGKPPFPPENAQPSWPGWAVETSLDLQWAHAIAPDAKLVLVAPHPKMENLVKGVAYAVEHYPGCVISQSWAVWEPVWGPASDEQIAKYHKVYERARDAGCTVLSASGDEGAYFWWPSPLWPPLVEWPASDPLVTACGGTQLQWGWRWKPTITLDAFWTAVSEVGWVPALSVSGILADDDPTPVDPTEAVWNEPYWFPFGSATGGGLSDFFATPDFQAGLPNDLLNGRRGVPDISWNAAMNGGVMIYMSEQYSGPPGSWVNGWTIAGGTSASTPQLAGVIALANQLRADNGKKPLGYLNPVLYTLPPEDFNDIVPQTFGTIALDSNGLLAWGCTGYATTPGYDLTTGLGSPKADKFVHDLAKVP